VVLDNALAQTKMVALKMLTGPPGNYEATVQFGYETFLANIDVPNPHRPEYRTVSPRVIS
jgi:hypothetical protein